MPNNRREVLAGLSCSAAGAVAGAAAERPVYSNFFGSPIRLDRHTRNMRDLVASRIVETPSLQGGRSLELEFRFSKPDRFGLLVWDLAPRRINRMCFHIFNPNPEKPAITLKPGLLDLQRRNWQLKSGGVALAPGQWTKIDAALPADFIAGPRKEGEEPAAEPGDPVFFQLFFRFEVAAEFSDFGQLVRLYFDGLLLF